MNFISPPFFLWDHLTFQFLIFEGERWQYAVVPLNPVKSTTTDWSSYENYPYYTGSNNGMGVYGYAISGGTFFDTRSAAGGATALDNELERLDTCLGHSAPTIYQYHYHAVITCLLRIFDNTIT